MNEIKEKYIGFVEKIFGFFNQKQFAKYIDIARNPIGKIKTLDLLSSMIITIIILNFILEVIPSVISVSIIYISNYLTTQYIPSTIEIITVSTLTLLSGVILVISLGIYALIEYVVALILGGKGTFENHFKISYGSFLIYYVLAIPLLIISAVLTIIQSIPVVNILVCILFLPLFIVGVIELIIGLYSLYIKLVMVKELHKVETLPAIIVMVSPVIAIIILSVIIFALIVVTGISLASFGIPGLN